MDPTNPKYLERIGRFVFEVSGLEWRILGYLRDADPPLPGFDLRKMVGKTTTKIGEGIDELLPQWTSRPGMVEFGNLSVRALKDVGERRNHVLHARPAAGARNWGRLWRWRWIEGQPADSFEISDAYLEKQLAIVLDYKRQINSMIDAPMT